MPMSKDVLSLSGVLTSGTGTETVVDDATSGTPISLPVDTDVDIPNDGAGTGTDTGNLPTGVTFIWNTISNSFDFSGLSIGDSVNIQIDVDVTTTLPSSIVDIKLELGDGSIIYMDTISKPAAGLIRIARQAAFTISNSDIRDNPCKPVLRSSLLASAVVRRFHTSIWRR